MINYQRSTIPLIINIGIRDSKFFTVDDLMLQNVNLYERPKVDRVQGNSKSVQIIPNKERERCKNISEQI